MYPQLVGCLMSALLVLRRSPFFVQYEMENHTRVLRATLVAVLSMEVPMPNRATIAAGKTAKNKTKTNHNFRYLTKREFHPLILPKLTRFTIRAKVP